MNLKCETILDFYTHKNRKVFCQIKVLPSKSHKMKNTCRSLTSDQWNTFEKELEKLLDDMKSSEGEDKENLGKFVIRPNIEVIVKASKLSLKYFCKLLSINGDHEKDIWGNAEDVKDIAVVLECLLDLQHEAIFALSHKPQEYEPQLKTSSLDGKLSTSLTYEPYTPSKTKYCAGDMVTEKTLGVDLLNYNEDTYSPKPLFETTTAQPLDEIIPKYKPAPIKENAKSKIVINDNIDETKDDVFAEKSKEEYIPEAQKISIFDIPAYVPTPIKIFHERSNAVFENQRLRGRSKTIDAMPKDLPISIFGNQKSKLYSTKCVEPLNENILNYKPTRIMETCSSRDSNKFENNYPSDIINETDDETVPLHNHRPLRLKSNKNIQNEIDIKPKNKEQFVEDLQENMRIDKDTVLINTHFKGVDEILPEYCNKTIKKRSKTLDSMPKEIKTDNEKLKINKITEEDKKTAIPDLNNRKSKEKKNDSNKTCAATNRREQKSEKLLRSTLSSEDEHFAELSKRARKHTKTYSKESDNDFEDAAKVDKKKCINESALSSAELNATGDTSPTTEVQKSKNSEQPKITLLRRSDRSPSKPKRFITEISGVDSNRQKKPKKFKTSSKNKELFGSDDDDDENDNDFESNVDNNITKKNMTATIFETPISKKPTKCSSSSSSSSTKKKTKADRSSDCKQEKRDISKWLTKKKTSILDPETATSKVSKKSERSKSPLTKSSKKSKSSKKPKDSKEVYSETVTSTCENFDMPSKKELEEIRNKSKLKQKENEKFKAELDKMLATPPKEVENLSLQDMSLNDILDTFTTYKSELDEIYKKNCKRDYIKGHDGINHCFVIQLLQQNVQMKMLEKLTDVYSNSNNTMQATLYANALLPEWIIRVYMEKFNFTRQEAINQIKAQDDYRLHMEEQNDGSFIFN